MRGEHKSGKVTVTFSICGDKDSRVLTGEKARKEGERESSEVAKCLSHVFRSKAMWTFSPL